MYEPLRIFGILLYKSWLVRKQDCSKKLFPEIIAPLICIVLIIQLLMTLYNRTPVKVEKDHFYEKESFDTLLDIYLNSRIRLYYAPHNSFTFELMEHVKECLKYRVGPYVGFTSESAFDAFFRNATINRNMHVLIFDESTDYSSKHLNYKLRFLSEYWKHKPLYNDEVSLHRYSELFQHYTMKRYLAQMQICVDASFIIMKSGRILIPSVYIQRVPHSARIKQIPIQFYQTVREQFRFLLLLGPLYPLAIEILRVAKEKFSGVNVLMSMYGISNTLNLLSWLTSGVLYVGVLLYLPLVIYSCYIPGEMLSLMHYGNPLLLYFVLIFYLAHMLALGIHVSAYFSRASLVTIAFLIWTFVMIFLQLFGFNEDTLYLAPYAGIIFPSILFDLALEEINAYETKTEGIHFYNLFVSHNPAKPSGGSVGVALIFFVIGTILHFVLAVYIYAVKPGRYGVAKHPLYFWKYIRKEKNDEVVESATDEVVESVDDDNLKPEYFEAVPEDVYTPRIQIQNLKKVFDINLFTKEEVKALRGVTIDFYNGQMTSLLGHNGAGKTTMMSILTGITSPTEGTVLVDGKDLKTNASEIIKDMGLCTQENICFSTLSVSDQLLFFTMLKRKNQKQSERRKSVEALLLKLKLDEKKDVLPDKLSNGQKRRLCLGMALAGDASILVLDEPTYNVDPESRRVIWNILLEMRGQKTILVSTRDMEEAEILGDKIAILHDGRLKSYGTSLFLKRLIGQNYVEITLSIEPRSDPEKVRSGISKDAVIIEREANRLIVKIPNTSGLPDTLDNLEKKKKDLGVTSFSVSHISLEHVFSKMTEKNEEPMPRETDDGNEEKLTGEEFYKQIVRALLSKKLTFTLKNYSITLTKLFTIIVALITTAIYLKRLNSFETALHPAPLPINPNMYLRPEILYKSSIKSLSDRYKSVSQKFGVNAIEVTNDDLNAALLKRANDNPIDYNNYLIAAAEINDSSVTALFSETATYSLPISINLLSNTVLKDIVGPDYSITLSLHALPVFKFVSMSNAAGIIKSLFVYTFCLTMGMFVVHPSQEYTTKIKHLQRMTGVSGSTYWGTMFLFDLIEYAMLVVLIVIGFFCIDLALGLRLYGPTEILMEILLFMLFGISALPFVYLFSFFNLKSSEAFTRLVYITTSIFVLDLYVGIISMALGKISGVKGFRSIFIWICRLIPGVSFSHCLFAFYRTAATNARCYRLSNDYYNKECFYTSEDICCKLECYDGKCKKSVSFFDDAGEDIRLLQSMQCLCVTAVLYFVILACKESRTYRKSRVQKIDGSIEPNPDEQVQREKTMIFERIEVLRGNNPSSINNGTNSDEQAQVAENEIDDKMFLVYELKKHYDNFVAVKDVSFSVNRRECFVLLGTSGAGKSTTFRMMTGEEIPNHGIMYIKNKEFENNLTYCLSQMGYCPQQDAMLKRLNAYDHLKLFARLRGIPENQVENEVQAWIDILNLNDASQPSGSYSGGNKRRLNVGIALIGNPNLIMIVEPTTGVDPGARRLLWNVIKACQTAGQSVVLATHSMVESEVLSDRLAIMVDGKFVCIGASEQLKQRFGAGYDIQIKMNPEKATDQVDGIKNDMTQALNCVLIDENLVYLKYHVPAAGMTWKKMYDVMNGIRKKYDCIDDFLVSSSLEQLFLMFAKLTSSSSPSESNN